MTASRTHGEDLRQANEALEARVEERTAALATLNEALRSANAELQKEIAQRKRAEEEAQTLARFPAENPNPVLRLDAKGRILFANAASATLLAQWNTAIGSEAPAPWPDTAREALTGRSGTTVELECGARTYVVFVVPVSEAGYVNLYTSDITDRKCAELTADATRRLLEEERRVLRAVMNGAKNIHLVYLDPQFTFVRVNEAYAKTCGYSPDEMVGKNHFALYPHAENEAIFARVRDTCQPVEFHDKPFVFPDQPERGTTYWDWTLTPVTGGSGHVTGLIFSLIETTERKRAEEALRHAKDTLEETVRHRTAEVCKAVQTLEQQAEQLRTLAAEVTLAEQRERRRLADLLHDGVQQTLVAAKVRTHMLAHAGGATVQQGCEEIASLLQEALTDARTLTGELSPPTLHRGDLLAALEWLTRRMRDKYHLIVHVHTPAAALPSLSENLAVLLYHSVRELLFNTVKHARVQHAEVTLAHEADTLRLTVADAGVGFDPLGPRVGGGTVGGFGLLSIRERLDSLGGRLEVQSAPGEGSRFTLTVPLHAEIRDGAAPQPAAPPALASLPDADTREVVTRARVLLVDDHAVVRQGFARLLAEQPDMDVIGEAADGNAAVEMARELLPDVILMDVNMPGLNGIDATRVIHAEFPAVRILGLSVLDAVHESAAMREAGAVAHLSKSASADVLLAAIRAAGVSSGP